ncbi:putative capsid protein [Odonata associated gemycircularvirus 1]|uniref:Putative capsid protein n=1 Tax=Odonata associated gemycircularvirus 1 TaxID=1985390 RepID=A0A0B4UFN7_9VIRU|nr:putative capsid protein [Odonata associated gemycircularvirus 1]
MGYRGGPTKRALAAYKRSQSSKRRYSSKGKTRRYRKKTKRSYRRPAMTRKSLLNVTSRKKQDNMLSFSNTNGSGASQALAAGSLFVNGSTGYAMSLFCPTARSLVTAGATNTIVDTADRTSTTCYLRGYREDLRIQTSSPLPWLWRRICFTSKGATFQQAFNDSSPTAPIQPYSDTSIGMARKWFNLQVNNSPNTVANYNQIMFRGNFGADWNDVITAKVDTTRITVKSDRVTHITTGNNSGHFSERKLWYPMNRNLVYDDDENGAAETPQYVSSDAKAAWGDYYIVDYLVPGVGGTTSDVVNLNCTATLYWHEK